MRWSDGDPDDDAGLSDAELQRAIDANDEAVGEDGESELPTLQDYLRSQGRPGK